MKLWIEAGGNWVKVEKGKILEIQQSEDDFVVFDVTKKKKLVGIKSKLSSAKRLGDSYISKKEKVLAR